MEWEEVKPRYLASKDGRFLIHEHGNGTASLFARGDGAVIVVPSGRWPWIGCKSVAHAKEIAGQQPQLNAKG